MLELPSPEIYFPVSRNPFSFKAGLNKINLQSRDNRHLVFQIDSNWPHYIKEKQKARAENFSKYVQSSAIPQELEIAASSLIIETLLQQQVKYFSARKYKDTLIIENKINGEQLLLDKHYRLQNFNNSGGPPYRNLLDALCCQIQEDLSLVQINAAQDKIIYLHLCFPNHWAAEEKIGQSFVQAHETVPAMEKINKNAAQLYQLLANDGPFERFTWGLSTDNRLNHHPIAPEGMDSNRWHGRDFSVGDQLFLRVERQVTVPLPAFNSYLFTIRTYFLDIENMNTEQLLRLHDSIKSMSTAILEYKGLARCKNVLLSQLKSKAQQNN